MNGVKDEYLSISLGTAAARSLSFNPARYLRRDVTSGSERVRDRQRRLCPSHLRGVSPRPNRGGSRMAPAVREWSNRPEGKRGRWEAGKQQRNPLFPPSQRP